MSYSEDYDWRCINCDGFHGYGNCPYYDQRWENRPDICWEGDEDFNPWNPPYHPYYGENEHQPLEQEEPHQGHGDGKKILEELLEGITRISKLSPRRMRLQARALKFNFRNSQGK